MNKLLAVLAILALAGCGKIEQPNNIVKPVAIQAPSVSEATRAVLRAHPNALQACYDNKLNGFFLDYGPLLKRSQPVDNYFHGWRLLLQVEYYESANGFWFITDQPLGSYLQAYPVVAGLPCFQH